MSPRSKREYLAAIVKRYRAAFRKMKTAILNEFSSTCGYCRSKSSSQEHQARMLEAEMLLYFKMNSGRRSHQPAFFHQHVGKIKQKRPHED